METRTRLTCAECTETFEVSTTTADAMHKWRAESREPFLCVECATDIHWGDAIAATDKDQNNGNAGEISSGSTPSR